MLFLTLGVTKAVGYFVPHEVSLWLWAHTACLWGMTCQSSVLSHINLIQFSLWWAVHTLSHMRSHVLRSHKRSQYSLGLSLALQLGMPIFCFVHHHLESSPALVWNCFVLFSVSVGLYCISLALSLGASFSRDII